MAKSGLNPNVLGPKVLIGLSIFLVLIGGTALNPVISFICFVSAGILMLIAGLKGKRWTRYIAFFLLIGIIALTASAFFQASYHLSAYRERVHKSKTATEGIK